MAPTVEMGGGAPPTVEKPDTLLELVHEHEAARLAPEPYTDPFDTTFASTFERLMTIDYTPLSLEEILVHRSELAAEQARANTSYLASVGETAFRVQSAEYFSDRLMGAEQIYLPRIDDSGESVVIEYFPCSYRDTPGIYAMRDLARRMVEAPAFQAAMERERVKLRDEIMERSGGVAPELWVSEDGSRSMFFLGTEEGLPVFQASCGVSLIQ